MTTTELASAIALAAKLHAGQVDKAGRPYIAHVCAVIAGVSTPEEMIVAALHDTVEDCGLEREQIASSFGADIADAVDALTRRPHEDYLGDFIPRVARNKLATPVKLADLRHNSDLSRLERVEEKDLARRAKYQAAIAFLESVSGRISPA